MRAFLLALLLLATSVVQAEVVPIIPGSTGVVTHQMGDDGYAIVPLQFGFPFYGKTFTHSVMFDNGVVGLFDPTANIGCNPQVSWCGGQQWSAPAPNTNMGSQFSYMVSPLWADIAPNPATRYYTQGTTEYQGYLWENIHEFYSGGTRLNTFGVELRPSGSIEAYYNLVNISTSNTFVGTIGNPSAGEWNTIGYYPYGTILNQISNWSLNSTGTNPCVTDPLSSPSCPGYAEAYLAQQCSISALYNTACPGYQQAYFTQQCSLNALYNEACPGYALAYLNYQCSINALYSTTCEGYEQAYYNQQCSLNPLYHTGCTGYAEAYFDQQCSLNGLYDRQCPNYAEAYALANVVTTPTNTTNTSTEPVIVVTTNNTSTAPVALVSDPVVNKTITTTTTATTPAAVAAPVQLQPAPASTTTTAAMAQTTDAKSESKTEDTKESSTDTKTESKSDSKKEDNSKSGSTDKPAAPTAREQIAAKRKEAAMQTAVRAGAEAAAQLDSATSMASQVAVQNVVLAAMGYNPGFAAYSFVMPDGNGYKPLAIYKNQKNVDNRRLNSGLSGASDRLHDQLINLQYNKE